MSQVRFVEETNALLNTATDANTEIDQALKNARSVTRQLSAIHLGTIVIEPPLNHDQFTDFRDRAETIITIGEKATQSLASAEQARTDATSSFAGTGSSVKS